MDWEKATYRRLQGRCEELGGRHHNRAALQLKKDIKVVDWKMAELTTAGVGDALAHAYEPSTDIDIIDVEERNEFTQIKKLRSGVGGAVFHVKRGTSTRWNVLKEGEYEEESYLHRPS